MLLAITLNNLRARKRGGHFQKKPKRHRPIMTDVHAALSRRNIQKRKKEKGKIIKSGRAPANECWRSQRR